MAQFPAQSSAQSTAVPLAISTLKGIAGWGLSTSKMLIRALGYVFAVASLVFFIFTFSAQDPAQLLAGQRSDVITMEAIRKDLGLDQPIHLQYLQYINDLSPLGVLSSAQKESGNYHYISLISVSANSLVLKLPYLRRSFQNNRPVLDLYLEKLPGTLILTFSSLLIAVVSGVFLGIFALLQEHRANQKSILLDQFLTLVALLGISVPSFFAAVVFAYLFAVAGHAITGLDVTGYIVQTNPANGQSYIDLKYLILPTLTLSIRPLSVFFQLTKDALADALAQDYIRTAHAKGLSNWQVLLKHGLPNAINPLVGSVASWFGSLLTGAFFVEFIFNWEGVGKLTVDAIAAKDFPLLLGCCVFTALVFVMVNFASDYIYKKIDPRIT